MPFENFLEFCNKKSRLNLNKIKDNGLAVMINCKNNNV